MIIQYNNFSLRRKEITGHYLNSPFSALYRSLEWPTKLSVQRLSAVND